MVITSTEVLALGILAVHGDFLFQRNSLEWGGVSGN